MCVTIQEGASQLEKSKFIPLMYQLAARMSSKSPANDTFQEVLQEVSIVLEPLNMDAPN